MTSNQRKKDVHQNDKSLEMLESLANAPVLEEASGMEFVTRLRTVTKDYWPDLWGRPGDTEAQSIDRALGLLRKIRWYLRQAWSSRDPHARDWYLQRARTWHFRHLIQPRTKDQRDAVAAAITADDARALRRELDLTIDSALDEPPARTGFSEALGRLERVGHRLRYCPADGCQQPYFIANRKGQEYCGAKECLKWGNSQAQKRRRAKPAAAKERKHAKRHGRKNR